MDAPHTGPPRRAHRHRPRPPYTLLDTDGTITIRVPDEATQGLPAGAGAWDLLLEDPSGDVTRLAAGPALVETTVSDTERSPH